MRLPANSHIKIKRRKQSGAVLMLGLYLIVSVLFLGVLVVDLARLELAAQSLQRAADAMALGAAERLRRGPLPVENSQARVDEWRKAKLYALYLMRNSENSIYGATNPRDLFPINNLNIEPTDCVGDLDASDDPRLQCRTFDFSDVTFTIERGYYFRPEVGGIYGEAKFVSLEGVFTNPSAGPTWDTMPLANSPSLVPIQCLGTLNIDGSVNPGFNINPTGLANAVRIQISLRALPLTLGPLLKVFTGPSISREAIASSDITTVQGAVAPADCH